jgi:hypothetical protein
VVPSLNSTLLLSLLWNEMIQLHGIGNQKSFKILARLFFGSCQPYFRFLGQWMRDGILQDGKHEFFIIGFESLSFHFFHLFSFCSFS